MKLEVAHEVNAYINGEVEALVLRLMELDSGDPLRSPGDQPPGESRGTPAARASQRPGEGIAVQARRSSSLSEDASERVKAVEAANSAFVDFKSRLTELQRRAEAAETNVAATQMEYSAQVASSFFYSCPSTTSSSLAKETLFFFFFLHA